MTSPAERLRLVAGPSNRPLLDALAEGRLHRGLVLVRSDGRVIGDADAQEADWLDLDAQLAQEPLGAALSVQPS